MQQGAIEADGISTGFGSDAGFFSFTATGAMQCLAGGTACASGADCAPGDACVERGGQVVVQAPVSAAGGSGFGFGCHLCEVRGTGAVAVSAAIDVSGGKQHGVGGEVSLTGGGDLTVGPGSVTADAADGGDVHLTAGSRVGVARDVGGALRIVNGTQVRAAALNAIRFGGTLQLEGCDVTLEPSTALIVDGGSSGHAGQLSVVAHERLAVQSLATLSALPDGAIALSYRADESIAPDATLEPPSTPVMDSTLTPCPACGNGRIEPPEECDGRGTCPLPGEVCLPPGSPDDCTCALTCGNGRVDPGEDCDGANLGGATCVSLGFGGGTLACGADCAFDTSHCGPERCGDGLVGPDEQCDPGGSNGVPPPSFGGATCESLGFPAGGSLACAPDCSAIITVPHCARTVTQACTTDAECPAGETCTAGCAACGNGFVDPGEQCDEGAGNGDAPNHCRPDCTLPRCGDATVDFSHCTGNPDAACTTAADCPAGAGCVAGEACDLGTAICVGGTKAGAPCCTDADCPGGDCTGDGCTANRNDIPGCCRCDCTLSPSPSTSTTSSTSQAPTTTTTSTTTTATLAPTTTTTSTTTTTATTTTTTTVTQPPTTTTTETTTTTTSTTSTRATSSTSTTVPPECTPGVPGACDDGDRCTVDSCTAAGRCHHERLGYAAIAGSLAPSLDLQACTGQRIPPAIGRLMRQARKLVERAARARPKRAGDLVRHALGKLTKAVGTTQRAGRHGLSPECVGALGAIVGDARAETACLLRPAGVVTSRALTAPTGRG